MTKKIINPWGEGGKYWKNNALNKNVIDVENDFSKEADTKEISTAYIVNNSAYIIYFKPESEMIIDSEKYLDDGAYPLGPGETWNYPVDGVKTGLYENKVFKIPGKLGFNGTVVVDINGSVDLDFYGIGDLYNGWLSELPAPNWTNLWNSVPCLP